MYQKIAAKWTIQGAYQKPAYYGAAWLASSTVGGSPDDKAENLPDPVESLNKYDIAFNVVRAVLVDMGYAIQLEDRKGGRITTKPNEFITGSLTFSETGKVAVIHDTLTGNWQRARESSEVLLEIVKPTETLVTVQTQVEALNRDLDGTEKWVPLGSWE